MKRIILLLLSLGVGVLCWGQQDTTEINSIQGRFVHFYEIELTPLKYADDYGQVPVSFTHSIGTWLRVFLDKHGEKYYVRIGYHKNIESPKEGALIDYNGLIDIIKALTMLSEQAKRDLSLKSSYFENEYILQGGEVIGYRYCLDSKGTPYVRWQFSFGFNSPQKFKDYVLIDPNEWRKTFETIKMEIDKKMSENN